MIVPTIPNFTDGTSPSLANLNSLATAVNLGCQSSLMFKVYNTGTQSIGTSFTQCTCWTAAAINLDANWVSGTPGSVVINTQGLYEFEARFNLTYSGTSGAFDIKITQQGGVNNPNGAGPFTVAERLALQLSGGTALKYISGVAMCYVGDTIEVWGAATTSSTLPISGTNFLGTDYAGVRDDHGAFLSGRLLTLGGTP